jgi:hypothetical protein
MKAGFSNMNVLTVVQASQVRPRATFSTIELNAARGLAFGIAYASVEGLRELKWMIETLASLAIAD